MVVVWISTEGKFCYGSYFKKALKHENVEGKSRGSKMYTNYTIFWHERNEQNCFSYTVNEIFVTNRNLYPASMLQARVAYFSL